MRVLVCGSREYCDVDSITNRLSQLDNPVIVHGAARGVDTIAGAVSRELGFTVEEFPVTAAEWRQKGKRAGIMRNNVMLDTNPDLVIAFWDGQSRGTKHTIDEARRRGMTVEVIT